MTRSRLKQAGRYSQVRTSPPAKTPLKTKTSLMLMSCCVVAASDLESVSGHGQGKLAHWLAGWLAGDLFPSLTLSV